LILHEIILNHDYLFTRSTSTLSWYDSHDYFFIRSPRFCWQQ